jgi:hypothetical protein
MATTISMISLGDQVAFLREALQLRVLEASDVIRWADAQIAQAPSPSYEMIELALMGGENRFDVSNQLSQVMTPSLKSAEVLPFVLARAHLRLFSDPGFGKVLAEGMYQSWVKADYDFHPPLTMCGYFDDAYSLAESGTMKTIEEVNQELLEFTCQFKDWTWPPSLTTE